MIISMNLFELVGFSASLMITVEIWCQNVERFAVEVIVAVEVVVGSYDCASCLDSILMSFYMS